MQADPHPPRFVPTLTEVVPGEAAVPGPSDETSRPDVAMPEIDSAAQQALMQHLAPLLTQQLRAALDEALRQHLPAIMKTLHAQVPAIVRQSLHQAAAQDEQSQPRL